MTADENMVMGPVPGQIAPPRTVVVPGTCPWTFLCTTLDALPGLSVTRLGALHRAREMQVMFQLCIMRKDALRTHTGTFELGTVRAHKYAC